MSTSNGPAGFRKSTQAWRLTIQMVSKKYGGIRMAKRTFEKIFVSLLVTLLLTTSAPALTQSALYAAPFAQQLRDRQVQGTLAGGQFAKIWLGLEPEQSGATISVLAEWDRPDPQINGVGFFILDDDGLRRIGEEALSRIAIAGGNRNFVLNGPSNVEGAALTAVGLTKYTIVVYNDSTTDANFKLSATNGFITDDSNQVTGLTSAPAAAATEEAAAPTDATVITSTVAATPTQVAPAATTTTTTTTATTTTAPAAVAEAPAVSTTSPEVRGTTLQGDLPEQDDQHFLGLAPSQRDGTVTLKLTFDPQDSSELARRLNFWVLDEAGLNQYLRGTSPGEVAIAAGNRTFRGDTNERVASFNAVGLGTYTVIVYNNSRVPGSYTLSVEGGTLSDGSGQTNTAQAAGVAGTGTVTATTTGATTAPAAVAVTTASTTTVATVATTAREGQPGGTYTVQSGDTVALIARDIYGDVQLYQQICAFNGIANCDLIEVGDVIRLPTSAQIQSGATAPATVATPVATPATASASAAVTTTTAITPTSRVTTTTAITPTRTLTTGRAVTSTISTRPVATPATSITATRTTTTSTTSSAATGQTIIDAMQADGRFTSLVEALQATGLDGVLETGGPYTVFAPTDAAFAALPAGAFEQLLEDPNGQLTDILRYHLIPDETMAEDISNGMTATTVQGKLVRFEVLGNTIKINGANIITRDVETENGVVHVIDAVILPPPD
jgi:uncharacterized surface protein with fasciclin (FAS1) repeats